MKPALDTIESLIGIGSRIEWPSNFDDIFCIEEAIQAMWQLRYKNTDCEERKLRKKQLKEML